MQPEVLMWVESLPVRALPGRHFTGTSQLLAKKSPFSPAHNPCGVTTVTAGLAESTRSVSSLLPLEQEYKSKTHQGR